jgi:uncharacterized protein (UPF0333 family)
MTASKQRGYALLLTVLIVGAVAVTIATTLFSLSVNSAKTSAASEASARARALADACAEEALEQIRESTPFSGYGSLDLGAGTCGYFVTNLGGQNRSIVASSTVSDATRKVKITINAINPLINVTYWQEVVD